MQPIKRAAFTLEILSSWAVLTLLISALFIHIIYKIDIPMFPTLADDITKMTDVTSLQKLCMLILDATKSKRDLAWRLVSWGFSLAALWSAIFGLASVYLSRLLRDSDKSSDQHKQPGTLELAIAGELPLWKAFWLLYIALPYALGIGTQGITWGLKHYHIIETAHLADLLLTPLTLAAIQTAWLWAAMVTWRCASNTNHRAWGYLAQAFVLIQTVLPMIISMAFFGHFVLR
ncbi:hypothetical protein [uncultured Desulfuromonas sp.]|uniref:hypothetical protein n=1 Tax=uncultured Desulfuromonas sp. TaxID=181013 RepID=UPI002AAB0CFC|nr:hypothetical protein [uncultured Desulfuromonas sp.]